MDIMRWRYSGTLLMTQICSEYNAMEYWVTLFMAQLRYEYNATEVLGNTLLDAGPL